MMTGLVLRDGAVLISGLLPGGALSSIPSSDPAPIRVTQVTRAQTIRSTAVRWWVPVVAVIGEIGRAHV